jgi:hypothetical protein
MRDHCLAWSEVQPQQIVSVKQSASSLIGAPQGNVSQRTILPFNIDFKSTARTQAPYLAVPPGRWQSGKKMDDEVWRWGAFLNVTLQQHFGNPRRHAKVAVNLEGRAAVKEIGIETTTRFVNDVRVISQCKQVAQDEKSVIPVKGSAPKG